MSHLRPIASRQPACRGSAHRQAWRPLRTGTSWPAVTWAAGQGLTQFVDLGAGPPVRKAKARVLEDIHVTAQAANSSARVAYVDNDRVVVAHSRAFRAPAKGVAVAGVIRAAYVAGDSVPGITAGPCTSRGYGRRRQRFELPPGVVRDPADHAVQQAALGRVERALLRAVTWHGVRPTRAGLLAAIRLPDGSEFPSTSPGARHLLELDRRALKPATARRDSAAPARSPPPLAHSRSAGTAPGPAHSNPGRARGSRPGHPGP
jgi:hypothetical protein